MKNLFYGLAVAAIALATSAFTSMPDQTVGKATRVGGITANYLVQPAPGYFEQFSMGTPNNLNCLGSSDRHCIYRVTSAGKDSIPDLTNYEKSQIDSYLSNEWIEPASFSVNNKVYNVE
ncbi:hypothetical protein QG516_02050 [Pedobacter gandavensis]|uniref:hypothetical protein n=1 Tax=Pedobacter TaxID=84567 RepID=UPI001C998395|nr:MULTISPECIES: hypothetical protein [Pedobacter]WGQ10436.1 hypothetical protein QG516_02050 [Pedobacter gandavensis]